MATTAKIAKEKKTPKFKIRLRNRCQRCGRPRAFLRKFALCRLCFRKLALEGDIAGVTKSSWCNEPRALAGHNTHVARPTFGTSHVARVARGTVAHGT